MEKKINENCSNIYLIDENLCLNKSLYIINANFKLLSANSKCLLDQTLYFNAIYDRFYSQISKYETAISNMAILSAKFESAYATVNSLSSTWAEPITITYNEIVTETDWNTFKSVKLNDIRSWLITNFPTANYKPNQIFNINVIINKNDPFQFVFDKTYYEACATNSGAGIDCSAGCGKPNRQCNITERAGRGTRHYCINLYDRCNSNIGAGSSVFGCKAYGANTLILSLARDGYDTYINKSENVKFRNFNGDWELI